MIGQLLIAGLLLRSKINRNSEQKQKTKNKKKKNIHRTSKQHT